MIVLISRTFSLKTPIYAHLGGVLGENERKRILSAFLSLYRYINPGLSSCDKTALKSVLLTGRGKQAKFGVTIRTMPE